MAENFVGGLMDKFGSITSYWVTIVWIIIAFFVLIIIIGLFYWLYSRKRLWNLDVEFKIPRSDGKLINAEWGKGGYNAKKGVVYLKRPGFMTPKNKMKPFDIKKYIQGQKILTVIQVGSGDYKPVLPDSFIELKEDEPMRDEKTGEIKLDKDGKPIYQEATIMNIKIDTSEDKAWRDSFERQAKATYSITSLLHEYAQYIGWGIIMFMQFAGFAILWARIK